jgi:molybdenum-dependent DNA-binding transcriptional regulator ModE
MNNRKNLELGAVRVLRQAVSSGSMGAAAKVIGTKAEAVRERIKTLERHTGKTLLVRSTRGCRLTESGRALLESYADLLQEELTETRRLLQKAGSKTSTSVGQNPQPAGIKRPGARFDITLRCLEDGQWAATSRPLELIAVSPELIETLRQIAQELVQGLLAPATTEG